MRSLGKLFSDIHLVKCKNALCPSFFLGYPVSLTAELLRVIFTVNEWRVPEIFRIVQDIVKTTQARVLMCQYTQ